MTAVPRCPQCDAELFEDAVVCPSCGETFRRLGDAKASRKAKPAVAQTTAPPRLPEQSLPRPAGTAAAAPRTAWPTVIGVISAILGIGGILYGIGNMILTIAVDPSVGAPEIIGAVIATLLLCGLALWLLVAGLGVIRRSRFAVRALQAWAATKAVLAIGCLGCTMALFGFAGDQITQMPGAGLGDIPPMMIVVILGALLLWQLLWPAFVLIWLLRSRVRKETALW